MTIDALIARALSLYPFRSRGRSESASHYRRALTAHVESRDWALAHELRTGRAQSDWTTEDVAAFHAARTNSRQWPREDLRPGTHAIPYLELDTAPATENGLRDLARRGLDAVCDRRRDNPRLSFPILIHLVLTDGRVRLVLSQRDDRIAILRTFARSVPLFGFVVIADTFMHRIINDASQRPVRADKTDAFVAHIGTRDLRIMMTRPYRVDADRVTFGDVPPDLDKRDPGVEDPYAVVFAMDMRNS
jgi:hypothetical protein